MTQIRLFFAVSMAALTLCPSVFANDLSSETTAGKGTTTEALTYSAKGSSPWSWDVGYTYSRIVDNQAAGQVIESTNQVTGGVEWERNWLAGAGVSYASTPSEYLTSVGPNFEAGYTWKLGTETLNKTPDIRKKEEQQVDVEESTSVRGASPKVEEEPEQDNGPFRPSVGLKSNIAFLNYRESFPSNPNSSPGRANKPANTAAQILQTGWTWELDVNPVEWLGIKATYEHFYYNRDVNRFLSYLSSQRAVSLGISGFSNTVQGFQTNQETIGFMIYPADTWELDLEGDLAKSATDGSYTKGLTIKAAKELSSHWKAGLGYEYANNPQLAQSLGVLDVIYTF